MQLQKRSKEQSKTLLLFVGFWVRSRPLPYYLLPGSLALAPWPNCFTPYWGAMRLLYGYSTVTLRLLYGYSTVTGARCGYSRPSTMRTSKEEVVEEEKVEEARAAAQTVCQSRAAAALRRRCRCPVCQSWAAAALRRRCPAR